MSRVGRIGMHSRDRGVDETGSVGQPDVGSLQVKRGTRDSASLVLLERGVRRTKTPFTPGLGLSETSSTRSTNDG